jgi:hypothetical protein
LCCIYIVSTRKIRRKNKKYHNKLKKVVKQKELKIMSFGNTSLNLKDKIAQKNYFHLLFTQNDYESNFNKKFFLNIL